MRQGNEAKSVGLRVLVTDLDNTLWDWFRAWYESFDAMVVRLSEMTGIERELLESEIHKVHQAHGTSEYSNLLNELPSLQMRSGNKVPIEVFDDAMHRLNSKRKSVTRLYPGVRDTLLQLRQRGITIAAYTESIAYWTAWRIKHTKLDGIIDVLYSAPDHDLPNGMSFEDLRRPEYRLGEGYELNKTIHRHIPKHEVKPNPEILIDILSDLKYGVHEALYVGDSLMKDVAMAQAAGVLDAHAKYGEAQHVAEYDLLRRVSHWPDAVIEKERELITQPDIIPTITLQQGFGEILQYFDRVNDKSPSPDRGMSR